MPVEIYTRNQSDNNGIYNQENEIISQLENVEIHSKEVNFILKHQLGLMASKPFLEQHGNTSENETDSLGMRAEATNSEGVATRAPFMSQPNQSIQKGLLKIGKKFLEWNYHNEIIFKFLYPEITLHAIARDDAIVGSRSCIYLQLSNTNFYLDSMPFIPTDENGDELKYENDDDDFLEMRLVPDLTNNRGIVDDVFAALCEASALHQDEEQDDSIDDAYTIPHHQNTSNSGWITSENISSFTPSQDQQVCKILDTCFHISAPFR
jgi:hypothetical protein